jgi:hypothetical protein
MDEGDSIPFSPHKRTNSEERKERKRYINLTHTDLTHSDTTSSEEERRIESLYGRKDSNLIHPRARE